MKACPCCGKIMVEDTGSIIYPTNPPQYDLKYRCFGCGYTENTGRVYAKTRQEKLEEDWKRRQRCILKGVK